MRSEIKLNIKYGINIFVENTLLLLPNRFFSSSLKLLIKLTSKHIDIIAMKAKDGIIADLDKSRSDMKGRILKLITLQKPSVGKKP